MCKIRKLKASEIDCRVSTISSRGCSLILYMDARMAQNILDETFGVFGWQRKHELIGSSMYCTVSVRNPETGEWISKQDVGTKGYTEEEKGLASDSFKRACFNFGIGRELFTAPFVWINAGDVTISDKNGKPTTYDKFYVADIGYDENGIINRLVIYKENPNVKVYTYNAGGTKEAEPVKETSKETPKETSKETPKKTKPDVNSLISKVQAGALMKRIGDDQQVLEYILNSFKIKSINELTIKRFEELSRKWKGLVKAAHGENT